MKISSLHNIYFNKSSFTNKKVILPTKFDTFERISFRGNLPNEISKNIPNDKTIDDLIAMAQDESNFRGEGANSKVYDIPYLPNHVLKVLNKDDPNGIIMNEFPSDINLGQPVWQSDKNPRLLILKKVEGNEHSIPSWSSAIWDPKTKKPRLITKEQAQIYFESVDKLAKMPQTAFDEICKKAKLLDDKGYKIDSINPNNLIVSDDEISIIDYFKVKPQELCYYRNCSYDLIAIMLDFSLLPEYAQKMNPEQHKQFLENAKIIFEKVMKSSKNVDFSTDVEIYKTYIKETSKWFKPLSVRSEDGKKHVRLYNKRANKFLHWLKKLNNKYS